MVNYLKFIEYMLKTNKSCSIKLYLNNLLKISLSHTHNIHNIVHVHVENQEPVKIFILFKNVEI